MATIAKFFVERWTNITSVQCLVCLEAEVLCILYRILSERDYVRWNIQPEFWLAMLLAQKMLLDQGKDGVTVVIGDSMQC